MRKWLGRWGWVGCGWLLAIGWLTYAAHAQLAPVPTPPTGIACAFNTSPPTVTTGNAVWVQCDSTGKLIVSSAASTTVAGSISNGSDAIAPTSTNLGSNSYNYGWNGTGWDRLQVDGSKNLKTVISAALPAGAATLGKVGPGFTSAQTPVTASATGTTAATTATLPGVSTKTTYICGWSVDADATAATVVNMTVTGMISGTFTRRQGVGPVASGTVSTWHNYWPCQPASTTNTAIAVVSGAAGAGGNTTVNAWGYQE